MTYTGGEYSFEAIYQELRRQVNDEDVRTFEEYRDLVDLLIEEKSAYGFYSDQEDLQQVKSDLLARWGEFHR